MAGKVVFKPYSQRSLFPLDLEAYINEHHPVRLISYIVDRLDISSLLATYKGGGTSSYNPRMLLKVLFYAYYRNIYSSRKIASHLESDIYFIWLSGGQRPDFRTIANFRGKRLKEQIHDYFRQITLMLHDMGVIDLQKRIYVDGTKLEANANKYSFVWGKQVKKQKGKLEDKINEVIKYIESKIKEESNDSDDSEAIEVDIEKLKEKVNELNKKINDIAIEKREKNKLLTKIKHLENKLLPKLEEYREKEEKLSGRNSYSKTDVDATFMRKKEDHFRNSQLVPSYNVQIGTQSQFILNYDVAQEVSDSLLLKVHTENYFKHYGFYPSQEVCDSGYFSEKNCDYLTSKGIDAYIQPQNYKQKKKKKFKLSVGNLHNMYYNEKDDYFVCGMGQKLLFSGIKKIKRKYSTSEVRIYKAQRCEGCPLRGVCYKGKKNVRKIEVSIKMLRYIKKQEEKLSSEEGMEIYSKRKIDVEPVFGNIKYNKSFRRFLLRGLDKVKTEFGLVAIAHNLTKLYKWLLQNEGKIPEKIKCFLKSFPETSFIMVG